MIQDIAPHVFHNQWEPVAANKSSLLVVTRGTRILARVDGDRLELPRVSDTVLTCGEDTFLFRIDDVTFHLAQASDAVLESIGPNYSFHTRHELRPCAPHWLRYGAEVASQLGQWYEDNTCCGRCGTPLVRDKAERMLRCPSCGELVYPRINPAVIVGVISGDRILVTKYADNVYKRFALVAGFTEIGETIEETVTREVLEETGVHVRNIRYYKSQPWPLSGTLLFGFFCEVDGDDHISMDASELAVARWMDAVELGGEDDGVSLTHEMMAQFRTKGRAVLEP